MADNKSIATRDSYGAALLELADAGHDDIVVFDADLSRFDPYLSICKKIF